MSGTDRVRNSQGLYVVRQGSGQPMLMLHGYGATSHTWRNLVSVLSPLHDVWLVDLKGHGQSSCPHDGKYAPQDHAELIYRLIIENDLRGLTLVGHSLGGGIALLLAMKLLADSESRLSSMVLIDSIALPQRIPFFVKIATLPLVGPMVLACLPAKTIVKSIMRTAFFDSKKIDSKTVDAYAVNLSSADHRYALIETARRLVPDDLKFQMQNYSSIDVPTLLIWGEQDRIVPPVVGVGLNVALPNSRYIAVENCGHLPQEEKPEEIIEPIVAFLSE